MKESNDKKRALNGDQNPIAVLVTPPNGLRAAHAICRDRGISDTTLWRWSRRGWIKTVNICGKNYVDLQSLAEFDRRAVAGEFSKAPAGAAGRSAAVRAAKEAGK